ncbi:MAG: ParB/RepB/Spo0J family partition protein [Gammaproteobacteria bacterium]
MNAVLKTDTMRLQLIPLDQLVPSRTASQVERRKYFAEAGLKEMAESIAAHGILQPIVVRFVPGEKAGGVSVPDRFEIVAGERRWLAASAAGLEQIPATVLELTDEQVIEVQLIENLQRLDVHPMQEAEGYHELVHTFGHPIEDVFEKVGKSRSYVYGRMKLLDLAPECRKAFYQDDLNASTAQLIARIPGEEQQLRALKVVTEKDWQDRPMSYRDAARYVHETFMLKLSTAPFPRDDAELVPAAGACGPCPMRTGNAPDLFGDVTGPDVCTNPSCFQSKKAAHVKRELEKARADGSEVIRGAAARKVLPDSRGYSYSSDGRHKQLRNGYARPRDVCLDDPKKRTFAQLAGKDAPTVRLQDPNTGRVEKVLRLEDVAERLKENGVAVAPVPKDATEAHEQKQERHRRNAELEFSARRALFQAVVAAAPKKLTRSGLIRIALALIERGWGDDEQVYLALGWEAPKTLSAGNHQQFATRLEKCTEVELNQIVLAMTAVEDVLDEYGEAEQLSELAKDLGVDAKKIRRDLAPKTETKIKPKTKPKTGVKVRKKAKK